MVLKVKVAMILLAIFFSAPVTIGSYKAQQCEVNLTNHGRTAEITCINSNDWYVLKNIKKGQYKEGYDYIVIAKGKKILSLTRI